MPVPGNSKGNLVHRGGGELDRGILAARGELPGVAEPAGGRDLGAEVRVLEVHLGLGHPQELQQVIDQGGHLRGSGAPAGTSAAGGRGESKGGIAA